MLGDQDLEQAALLLGRVSQRISVDLVGQKQLVQSLQLALICGGHVLLEGPPGVAKTTAVKAFCGAMGLDFKRIQFTPDLLPLDLLGTPIWHPGQMEYEFRAGRIFTDLLLADEINRAPAKVQSALLEAMQERQVSVGGETRSLSPWFTVLATQNPLEQEGTYPLPEAQKDRFMFQILVDYPQYEEELAVMRMHANPAQVELPKPLEMSDLQKLRDWSSQIWMAPELEEYALRLVRASRDWEKSVGGKFKNMVHAGASPRASIDLLRASKSLALLSGRNYVCPQDLRDLALPLLGHRIHRSFEALAQGISTKVLIEALVEAVPEP